MALRVRRTRRQHKTAMRLHKPRWVDPYPQIAGTEPEKRVFAALHMLNIYFIFQGQIPEFEEGARLFFVAPVDYKPDFVLPEYRIIIDPFSPFHHSLEGAANRDADKIARYAIAGYQYYHPWAIAPGVWDWDQYHTKVSSKVWTNLKRVGVRPVKDRYRGLRGKLTGRMGTLEMLRSIPEIKAGPRYALEDPRDILAKQKDGHRLGPYVGLGATSVAAANRKRAKPPALALRFGTRRGTSRQ